MLTLQLIRHAKTEETSKSGNDFDRKLTEKGIAQANLLGHYIQSYHLERGKILCSAALRTKQTHSIICQQTSEPCQIEYQQQLYHASKDELLKALSTETSNIITIIGHNNGISDLASYCSDEYVSMKTSELITLSFPFDSWDHLSQGTGIISLRYHPEAFLPEI